MANAYPYLVIATGNAHKIQEIREILTPELGEEACGRIIGMKQASELRHLATPPADPQEDGLSFAANALIKARAAAAAFGWPALADDSGICVDILGGAPGIFSARWCGEHGKDRENLELLLAQLADIGPTARAAHFAAATALVLPENGSADALELADYPGIEAGEHPGEAVSIGKMHGTLRTAPAGEGGFGYDPIFEPTGYSVTSAELSPEEKNAISHRGNSLRTLAPLLREILG